MRQYAMVFGCRRYRQPLDRTTRHGDHLWWIREVGRRPTCVERAITRSPKCLDWSQQGAAWITALDRQHVDVLVADVEPVIEIVDGGRIRTRPAGPSTQSPRAASIARRAIAGTADAA